MNDSSMTKQMGIIAYSVAEIEEQKRKRRKSVVELYHASGTLTQNQTKCILYDGKYFALFIGFSKELEVGPVAALFGENIALPQFAGGYGKYLKGSLLPLVQNWVSECV